MKFYCEKCPEGVEIEERQEAAFKAAGWGAALMAEQKIKPKTAARGRGSKSETNVDPNIADVGD